MLKLSEQQQKIVETVAANSCDIQVVARAGCGKTTTILAATEIAKGSVCFLAFNKSIATELASKAPKNVNVQTIHSLGFSALRNYYKYIKVEPDKTFQILKNYLGRDEWNFVSPVKKLVSLCKNNLTFPSDENLFELCEEYNVEANGDSPRIFELVRQVLNDSVPFSTNNVVIDFDDMIWLPSKLKMSFNVWDWVFVDEAQDLNAAQQYIILNIARKICFVGDDCQAIYHFRGADSDGMENLRTKIENLGRVVISLPLNFTRRCPKEIVKLAQYYVPDFFAMDDAPQGIIEHKAEISAIPGDMVLCRLNAPLVPIAYSFLRNGVPVKIQGKDIGAGLLIVIKKLKATSIDDLLGKLEKYELREVEKLQSKLKDTPTKLANALQQIKDKTDTLKNLAVEQSSIDGLVGEIERLFSDINNPQSIVLLSTIHKAKGLEAPTVWIVETPSRPGKQENNIHYVAITRAKNKLVFVKLKESE